MIGRTILLLMMAQHRLIQHFDMNKRFKRVCAAVLFSNINWEEQKDNKWMSPQEVKLRCGILDVNNLWGHESSSYNLYDIIIHFDASKSLAGGFCSNFREIPEYAQLITRESQNSVSPISKGNKIRTIYILALPHRIFVYSWEGL